MLGIPPLSFVTSFNAHRHLPPLAIVFFFSRLLLSPKHDRIKEHEIGQPLCQWKGIHSPAQSLCGGTPGECQNINQTFRPTGKNRYLLVFVPAHLNLYQQIPMWQLWLRHFFTPKRFGGFITTRSMHISLVSGFLNYLIGNLPRLYSSIAVALFMIHGR